VTDAASADLARSTFHEEWSWGRKLLLGGEILAAYARVRWLASRRNLPRTLQVLRGESPPQSSGIVEQVVGLRLGHAVGRTLGTLPADSRCLMRSLVLVRMLAGRGIESTLVIGVRPGPEFEAHAWVESNGMALLPDGASRYQRLLEL
jgi:hypothetical protein